MLLKIIRKWTFLGLPLILAACLSTSERSAEGCGDFLSELGVKHEALKYKGCAAENFFQTKALKAEYIVEGPHAKAVEQQLHQKLKMPLAKFTCCGWSSSSYSTRGRDGHEYGLNFNSEETVEKDWKKISKFKVWVYRLLEEV